MSRFGSLNPPQLNQHQYLLFSFLIVLFMTVLIRTAWISDDAAITLRSVLNFVNGYGAVFNVGERVQAYTHPLWFIVVSGLTCLTDNVFYATLFLSFVCAFVAFYLLLFKLAKSVEWGAIAALALILSKSFIDYSTSGLENPLSFCLLAVLALILLNLKMSLQHKFAAYVLLFSLMFLTRPDLVLFVIPALLHSLWLLKRQYKLILKWCLLAGLPLIIWETISIVYYGFPLPNTAYAKLGMGIASGELVLQGFQYYMDSLNRDPITLLFIFFALFMSRQSPSLAMKLLSWGLVLYLLYVVKIGGDFMSGRFFAVPVFTAAILVVRLDKTNKLHFAMFVFLIVSIGLINPNSTVFSRANYENKTISKTGIADERGFYFQDKGLISGDRHRYRDLPIWPAYQPNFTPHKVQAVCGGLGYRGMYAGPDKHFIDVCALADPLLARIPAKYNKQWRVGHYYRHLPERYLQSVKLKRNELADQNLAQFYDKLNLITKGDIFTVERLKTIIAINFGVYDYLVDDGYYAGRPHTEITLNQVRQTPSRGKWDALGNIIISEHQSLTVLASPGELSVSRIELSVDNNDVYIARVKQGENVLWQQKIRPNRRSHGLVKHVLTLPKHLNLSKADAFQLTPTEGDGAYALGHLLLVK